MNLHKNNFATSEICFTAIWLISFALIMVTQVAAIGDLGYISWIFVIIGIMNASSGKTQPLPVIGTIGG